MSSANTEPKYYVGIGASAGGLEALDAFFSQMPADSGMAFIVIQHLSPDYKSLMVELLSKRTAMNVRRAEEGIEVEPNTVYLIPPRKQLTIFHGKLILKDTDHAKGINLPIDVFFRSLAEDQGEKAIAIILSGTGSDGVRGIRAVKEAGGMVMVQSEDSAKFDGMPRAAIATGLPDIILPPDAMPGKLISFAKHPFASSQGHPQSLLSDEDGLIRIFALLRDLTKVDFTYYKPSTVLRRIERRITVCQTADLRDYVRLLESSPGEVSTLYRELLIGVTSFFRDREVFTELGNTYLPALLKNTEQREVRFWVAGCSTGEEAYTLGILAMECQERMENPPSVKIFATDLDRDAILHAGNGLYAESIAADLPPGMLAKYFVRRDDHYQVCRPLREMVVFAQHNLIKDPPFTNIELLSCRNLLIYLQPVLQQKVLEFMNFSLNPLGILLLGTSETPGEMGEFFEPLHHRFKLFRSRGRRRQPAEKPLFQGMGDRLSRQYAARFPRSGFALSQREEERIQDRLLQSLAGDYVPLVAVVNEHNELLHLVGESEGLLRLPYGRQSNDITRMAVKELSIPLATGLQKVFHSGQEISYSNIRIPGKESARVIQMRIRPLPEKKGQMSLAAVILQEFLPARQEAAPGAVQELDISREAEQRILDLEQDLQFTKENLQATIEELETSNEELQATNEELLASNEELQSTNEELQSVNEELHTVNAEYQNKILELTEITNDLDNLISATRIATVFLDENLEIRKFTPAATRIFRILQSDIGRPISHLTHRLEGVDVLATLRQVERSGEPVSLEACISRDECYLMRVLPYVIGATSQAGMIITFTDTGPLKQSQKALARNKELLEMAQEMAHVGSWHLDLKTGRLDWSDEVYRIFGVRPGEFSPSYESFLAMAHPEDREELNEAYTRAVREGLPYEAIHRIVRPGGEVRIVHEKSMEGRDETGRTTHSRGMIHDVTDLVTARDALRFSQDYLRAVVDAMPAHVAILDQRGVIEYVNTAWHSFGRENGLSLPDGAVGTDYLAICDKSSGPYHEEAPLVAAAIREALRGRETPVEIEYPCHSGDTQRWFLARIASFETPRGRRVLVAHENITRLKLAECQAGLTPEGHAEPVSASGRVKKDNDA
ncbi:Chemotaxis protein methyltransferase [Fundidesulfovibrio magnetotacticus]|uniref:Chemotaxis protein methyltransferase n=1 Tax=Fundidesulfovibrio magnetotacticus TaxID=2730080 RepID=A0A6V8LS83_9BACT|nr:chemotaxis protein CheB [Fundidesulfovibrio magnetotacticus]GFK95332.1 Chemotaxis protein methyltransferase [Fundidesulfovibrio magnetotacticus]